MRNSACLLLLVLVAAPVSAFQSVHVVNGGSGTALQTAIDAAASGDTLLVHGGSFGGISINGKALTLVAEPALGTQVLSVSVTALAANQHCVLAGLDVLPNTLVPAIVVSNCAGSVRLEGVRARGSNPSSVDALVLGASNDVACAASTFSGGAQIPTPGPLDTPSYSAGRGVVCAGSQLALYDCVVSGGAGQTDHFINTVFWSSGAGPGGNALECDASSSVFASRTALAGGAGGMGRALTCVHLPCGFGPTSGANGGAGISAGAGAIAALLDCTLQGGAGGAGGSGGQCCPQQTWPQGTSGSPGAAELGSVTHFAGAGTTLSAPQAEREGNPLLLTIQGTPGDRIFLGVSSQTRFVFDPFYSGVFLFGPSAQRSHFGLIPGSGVLNVSIPLGTLPPGAQSEVRFLQVLARDPSGQLRLGSPAVVTVLDPSF